MLTSILNTEKEDFLEHINDIWKKECGTVSLKEFNRVIGDSKYSMIKFISKLTEKMYNERLAAIVDNGTDIIIGWTFFKNK